MLETHPRQEQAILIEHVACRKRLREPPRAVQRGAGPTHTADGVTCSTRVNAIHSLDFAV